MGEPVTERRVVSDSAPVKYLEWSDLQRWKYNGGCRGLGEQVNGGLMLSGDRVSVLQDEEGSRDGWW